jgi:thiamine-phosphate pyrophosphorylase
MKKLSGIYLVIDPQKDWADLFSKLQAALDGGISIVQVWNHWPSNIQGELKLEFARHILSLCQPFDVPVLMHDDWQLALKANLDGVHFDHLAPDFELVLEQFEDKYLGLTVSNDLEQITWATKHALSYISFCALFPSSSVSSCEIVDPENIKKARAVSTIPIFLSGGIRPENIARLKDLSFNGIAIISGILDSPEPQKAVEAYLKCLKELKIDLSF